MYSAKKSTKFQLFFRVHISVYIDWLMSSLVLLGTVHDIQVFLPSRIPW